MLELQNIKKSFGGTEVLKMSASVWPKAMW